MDAISNVLDRVEISSQIMPLDKLRVEFNKDPKACKGRDEIDANTVMILPDDSRSMVGKRFWTSWSSLFNIGRSVLDYWSYSEAFDRISSTHGKEVRITYQKNGNGTKLLSCTNPSKPILSIDSARNLISKYDGKSVMYGDGVATASFDCNYSNKMEIVGDEFKTRFAIHMPLDAYGLPSAYLEMYRLVCSNGAVAMSHAFKTQFQLSKEDIGIDSALDRVMSTFNNEEGYHALKHRFESAAKSWASIDEAYSLYDEVKRAFSSDNVEPAEQNAILQKLQTDVCKSPLVTYGLSSSSEISRRKARTIPVDTTMYDLINFASEVGTHKLSSTDSKNRLNAWIGSTISKEYNLEGTVESYPNFRDFFCKNI